MALAPVDSEWGDLREKLVKEVREGCCLCPMPLETIAEAAPCTSSQRVAIEEFFVTASRGVAFRPHTDMIINSTMALVRDGWPVPWWVAVKAGWAADEEFMTATQKESDDSRQRMIERMAGANPPPGAEAMDVKQIFDQMSAQRCGMAFRDLEKFQSDSTTAINDYEIPWLMNGLIKRQLTLSEANQLGERIRFHKWEAITENYFDLCLNARWEHDRVRGHRPNYKANDEIDRWRAAVALSSSNLFITDKYAASLCHRSGVLDIAGTTVLSITQKDEFRGVLEGSK
jgi:hypothetical protein